MIVIECSLHMVGYEGCPTQGARSLIVPHPTVQTPSVEYVATVRQPSDLVLSLELVQAHRAALRRLHRHLHLRELHHRQDFPHQHRRHRPLRPRNVGFEEIVEAHVAQEDGDEFSYQAQYG